LVTGETLPDRFRDSELRGGLESIQIGASLQRKKNSFASGYQGVEELKRFDNVPHVYKNPSQKSIKMKKLQ
jgi:hypothetical protein